MKWETISFEHSENLPYFSCYVKKELEIEERLSKYQVLGAPRGPFFLQKQDGETKAWISILRSPLPHYIYIL